MKGRSPPPNALTTAQRGQIVQRVIVEGWTTADAAAAAGVPERLVAAWVADYRRHGMASLRHRPGKSVAAEIVQLRLLLPVCLALRGIAATLFRLRAGGGRTAPPAPIRGRPDDRRETS
jgi:transposase-like protein